MSTSTLTNQRIYLDHNATSPLRSKVREAMIAAMSIGGNPSSSHQEGRKARAMIEEAREQLAALVGADAQDVLFTSGGTEASNTALSPGLVAKDPIDRQRAFCFVSAIEHPSVLYGGRFAPEQVKKIPVKKSGMVDIGAFISLLEAHGVKSNSGPGENPPFIVSVMLANNETGVIQPVTELAALVLERGGLMHSDAVQALGRMPFDLGSLGVDLVSIAAHKIGGPKGIGALIGPGLDNVLNDPLMTGGAQEFRRRAGTEDIISIAGFAAAAEMACEELADREMNTFLRDRLESRLKSVVPDIQIFSDRSDRLGNTSFLAIPGISAENLTIALDLEGIAVSSGTTCSSGKVNKSHVLHAMGIDTDIAQCAIRFSFGPSNWMPDVEKTVTAIEQIVKRHRKSSS